MSVRVPCLGPLLEPSGGLLGPSWRPLGSSWGPLGPSWGLLGGLWGRLGAILGASGAVAERREAENAEAPKTFKNHPKINEFCLLGPSWGASGGPFGTCWGLLEPSGGLLGRLGTVVHVSEAIGSDRGGLRQAPGRLRGGRGDLVYWWCPWWAAAPGPRGQVSGI